METMAPRSETAIVVAAAAGDKDGGQFETPEFGSFACKISRQSDSGTGGMVCSMGTDDISDSTS
jgi:hypothetical protein